MPMPATTPSPLAHHPGGVDLEAQRTRAGVE
jgi:hypothetical protein